MGGGQPGRTRPGAAAGLVLGRLDRFYADLIENKKPKSSILRPRGRDNGPSAPQPHIEDPVQEFAIRWPSGGRRLSDSVSHEG